MENKIFKASGYYEDEPEVLIQVDDNGNISLYNTFYDVVVENLPLKSNLGYKYIEAASKKYFIDNFIPYNNLAFLHEGIKERDAK